MCVGQCGWVGGVLVEHSAFRMFSAAILVPMFVLRSRLPQTLALVVLLVAVLAPEGLRAQERSSDEESYAPVPDTWALQFAINPNLDVASFSGSTLSIKRQFSSTQSLRVGLTLEGRFEDRTEENPQRATRPTEDEQDFQSYRIEGLYISHIAGGNDIHAYTGIGPFVSFASTDQSSSAQNEERDEDLFRLGAVGVLGVEWFLRSNLSVTAEYGFDVAYSRMTLDRSEGGTAVVDREEDRFSFGGRGATVGVSVYF